MHEKMIMSGLGGQGLMTLGKFVAEFMMDEYEVTFFPSYGSEVRGGTAYCHVIISDDEIASPVVEQATCLVVMNQVSYDRFAHVLEPEGLLVSNKSMIVPTGAHGSARAIEIDATNLAIELGDVRVANVILLGALNKVKELRNTQDIVRLIDTKLRAMKGMEALLPLNIKALHLGESLIEDS